jgi:hypothetical protein
LDELNVFEPTSTQNPPALVANAYGVAAVSEIRLIEILQPNSVSADSLQRVTESKGQPSPKGRHFFGAGRK